MQIIASDQIEKNTARLLDAYDCPAILMNKQYEIIAANDIYTSAFGALKKIQKQLPYCYEISHGYNQPCDEVGEHCPLKASLKSKSKERVLHIHNTPRGKKHINVELVPILDDHGEAAYFIECLQPVLTASAQSNKHLMVGNSPVFNKMLEKIERVATSDANVLLYGESGTGKELAAKAIHSSSQRNKNAFVAVECSGLSEHLFESEMFGHLKGAFTGANNNKTGLVEAAQNGTLFLDELGDVPLSLQVKLLRLIESGTYRPVGSTETKVANFRLICATHKNLKQMVNEGNFREDLFYRINVFPIYLPTLDERKEDIPLIAKSLLKKVCAEKLLSKEASSWLSRYHFSGNIRELRNILERACILSDGKSIEPKVLEESVCIDSMMEKTNSAAANVKDYEKQLIEQLLLKHNNNKKAVAKELNISLRTLYRKLQHSINDMSH